MKIIGLISGCWDGPELHAGHLQILKKARELADELIILVNSDSHVRIKKNREPVLNEQERARRVWLEGRADNGWIFDEDTPIDYIRHIKPDMLICGADYKMEDVAGYPECLEWGGRVILVETVKNYKGEKISTSDIIRNEIS